VNSSVRQQAIKWKTCKSQASFVIKFKSFRAKISFRYFDTRTIYLHKIHSKHVYKPLPLNIEIIRTLFNFDAGTNFVRPRVLNLWVFSAGAVAKLYCQLFPAAFRDFREGISLIGFTTVKLFSLIRLYILRTVMLSILNSV